MLTMSSRSLSGHSITILCENSPKLHLIKGPKSKFPRGACPQTPQFATCFAHGYVLTPPPPPPPIIHTVSFCPPPPPGKKLKETLYSVISAINTLSVCKGWMYYNAYRVKLLDYRLKRFRFIQGICKRK